MYSSHKSNISQSSPYFPLCVLHHRGHKLHLASSPASVSSDSSTSSTTSFLATAGRFFLLDGILDSASCLHSTCAGQNFPVSCLDLFVPLLGVVHCLLVDFRQCGSNGMDNGILKQFSWRHVTS